MNIYSLVPDSRGNISAIMCYICIMKANTGLFLIMALALLIGACRQEENLVTVIDGCTLAMDRTDGSIVYLGKEENLLSDRTEPLFRLRFCNDDGSFSCYDSRDAGNCAYSKKGKTARFVYSDFPGQDFKVSVSVRPDRNDGLFHFSMDVDTGNQIDWMEYPCISVRETSSEDEGILWPYNEGAFYTDASKHKYIEPEYPSRGNYAMCPGMVSTPFLAQVTGKGGVYFGAHDPARNTRQIDFRKTDGGIRLQIRLYPGSGKGSYKSSDETVLGCFEGTWHSAADIYRDWFDSCHEGFVPIEENTSLPEWYTDPFVVLTYCVRGHHDMDDMSPNKLFPYVNALPFMEDFSEQTGAPVMALLMHWEGTAPWAPPYVWPPYGGETALREFVDRMHAIGGTVGVYCSGMGWTQKSNLVDYDKSAVFAAMDLGKEMCQAPDGSLPLSEICTGQRSGYDLCPSRDFTAKTLHDEIGKIRSAGVDYIQMMDQNHGGTPYMCYSRSHSHPFTPGKWETEAANGIYSWILKDNPGLVLGCESAAAEAFIPNLLFSDDRNGLNFSGGIPVPLYSYIYHGYVTNFMGNNVCGDTIIDCRRTPGIFQYRLAYSFLAGDVLTVVIDDEGNIQWAWGQRDFSPEYRPDREAALSLIRTLTGWRKAMPEFLQLGRTLHPLAIECSMTPFYTDAGVVNVPDVLTASYGYKGRRAHFLVNWNPESRTVRCTSLEGKQVALSPDGEKTMLGSGSLELPPLSVAVVTE